MSANMKWLRTMMDKVKADLIREDGRLERMCEHGIGHTVGHVRGYLEPVEMIHGCCGVCCDEWPTQDIRDAKS